MGGQPTKIRPSTSPRRLLDVSLRQWRWHSGAQEGPKGSPREPSRVRKGPQGAQKGPQGASEGHLEFVCFLGAFLEGKKSKNKAFFDSKINQNLTKTEKGEKQIRAYAPTKKHVFEGGRLSKPLQKGLKKCADFRIGVLPLFIHFGDPLRSQNAPKMS